MIKNKSVLSLFVFWAAIVLASWVLYYLIGQSLIKLTYYGEAPQFVSSFMEGRNHIPLEDYLHAAENTLWKGTLAFTLLFVSVAVIVRIQLINLTLIIGSIFLAALLLFVALEEFPTVTERLNLRQLPYYQIKSTKIYDQALVYRKKPNSSFESLFIGSLYKECYGVRASQYPYKATYDENGFRNRPSMKRIDVAVIGDSFIEMGVDENDTFSSRLQAITGLETGNFGTASYCPVQYIEVLKRYVIDRQPQYVIMAFYLGNDLEDIGDYLKWEQGQRGWYYNFGGMLSAGFFDRFVFVIRNVGKVVQKTVHVVDRQLRMAFGVGDVSRECQDELVDLHLGSEHHKVILRPGDPRSRARLANTKELERLRSLFSEFKKVATSKDILPAIMLIPTSTDVYARYSTERSGRQWLKIKDMEIKKADDAALRGVVTDLAREMELEIIDLTPRFEEEAKNGQMLYYPFDSHWNSDGRQLAAQFVAQKMKFSLDFAHKTGSPLK